MKWLMILFAILTLYLAHSLYGDRFNAEVLSGKRVLVTGASRGIGAEMAYQYAKFGANVVITARNKKRLQNVLERCRAVGRDERTYHYISADMGEKSAPKYIIKEATHTLGGLDVVVLNHAALGHFNMWTGNDVDYTDFDVIMAVNVRSYIHLASLAFPHLVKTNGSIGVVSGIAARLPVPKMCPSAAAKGAIDGFFNSWNFELKHNKINVSITRAVLGLIDTDAGHTAMQHIMGFDSPSFQYAPLEETALAIIKATTVRQDKMFHPALVQLYLWLYDWVPSLGRFMYGEMPE